MRVSPSEIQVTSLVSLIEASLHHLTLTEEVTLAGVTALQDQEDGIHLRVTITVPHLITSLQGQDGLLIRSLITAPLPISVVRHHSEDGVILPCGEDLLASEEVLHTEAIICLVPMVPRRP